MHNEEGSERENNKDDTQVIVGRKGKEGEGRGRREGVIDVFTFQTRYKQS